MVNFRPARVISTVRPALAFCLVSVFLAIEKKQRLPDTTWASPPLCFCDSGETRMATVASVGMRTEHSRPGDALHQKGMPRRKRYPIVKSQAANELRSGCTGVIHARHDLLHVPRIVIAPYVAATQHVRSENTGYLRGTRFAWWIFVPQMIPGASVRHTVTLGTVGKPPDCKQRGKKYLRHDGKAIANSFRTFRGVLIPPVSVRIASVLTNLIRLSDANLQRNVHERA